MVDLLSMKKFMREALMEAKKAYGLGEVPIGAVITYDDKIIARGYNQVETKNDPRMHAEMIAIGEACKTVGNKFLNDCSMYVTLEPCSMCAGAIVLSRIKNLHIATTDPKSGACGSVFNIVEENRLNHRVQVSYGILEEESKTLLKSFFKELREKKLKGEY